jgi:hypothetical protein
MKLSTILDRNLGARIRAGLSIVTSLVAALSFIADSLDAIPEGTTPAVVALMLANAVIIAIGRFSSIGNKKGDN